MVSEWRDSIIVEIVLCVPCVRITFCEVRQVLCPRENLWHIEGRSTELRGKDEDEGSEQASEVAAAGGLDDAA